MFGRAQVSFVALLTSLAKRCQQSSKRFNSQCFFSIYKTQKKSFWLLDVALVAVVTLYVYSLHSLLTCEDIFVNMFLEDHYRNVNNMGTNCMGKSSYTTHVF